MSKILLVGYNPPNLIPNMKVEAAHYRTWQFLKPLLHDGHKICFCANDFSGNEAGLIPAAWAKQLTYHLLPFRRKFGWAKQLQEIHDAFDPDCIVAVNFDCALCTTKLKTHKPIWMDIYGDYLTIMQVARYRSGSDRGISTSIEFMRQVLKKGDAFSVCGTPQQHMLVGELAMTGRLNSRTFGYEFAHVVLPGAAPISDSKDTGRERSLLLSKGIPKDSFVVLWCGGYNTWTDVDTLFRALELVMSQNANVHYVSVGASTYGTPGNVYTRLQEMIENSPYRTRFHLLGWRPWSEIKYYYQESDIGLNIDALHYETIYGTRTRLVEMLAMGLPIVTSLGCELSDIIAHNKAGLTFESGDWKSMGQQIIKLATNKALYLEMSTKALNYAQNDLSFVNTTRSVRKWVNHPNLAPDKAPTNFRDQIKRLEYQTRSVTRQLIWQFAGLD